MMPQVFVLILNWNGWRDTIACLESVFRTSYERYRAVVIDNGSEDGSPARIREWAEGKRLAVVEYEKSAAESGGRPDEGARFERSQSRCLVLIRAGANLGFACGNNIGIRYALSREADYVLLLNNDAFFRSPAVLADMVDFMERTPQAGACGGRMFYPDGRPQQSYGNFPTVSRVLASLVPVHRALPSSWLRGVKRSNVIPDSGLNQPLQVDFPIGACMLVRRAAIETTGIFDERFFLYVEETDWCCRMEAAGWERYYLPAAEVIHVFGGSSQRAPVSMRRHHLRSQFIYFHKHYSGVEKIIAAAGYCVRSCVTIPFLALAELAVFGSRKSRRTSLRELRIYWQEALGLGFEMITRTIAMKRPQSRRISGKTARQI